MICQVNNVLKEKLLTGLIGSPGHSSSDRVQELTSVQMEDTVPGKLNLRDEVKSDRKYLNLRLCSGYLDWVLFDLKILKDQKSYVRLCDMGN